MNLFSGRHTMRNKVIKLFVIAMLALLSITAFMNSSTAQNAKKKWLPVIPKTWDDEAMSSLELPLAFPAASPKYISADYYYKMPVRPIFKSYPVYYPDKEPADYMNWLKQQTPEIIFDAGKLKNEQDWIQAGEVVFDAPIEFESSGT